MIKNYMEIYTTDVCTVEKNIHSVHNEVMLRGIDTLDTFNFSIFNVEKTVCSKHSDVCFRRVRVTVCTISVSLKIDLTVHGQCVI